MVMIHVCSGKSLNVEGKGGKQRLMLWRCGFSQLVRVSSQVIGCDPPYSLTISSLPIYNALSRMIGHS